ncbi:MAG TPA: DUF1501 domain-containing protein [Lentisphaeria bacterium]|nr:DUF1501 domain-containing protein [Lentisphaeria bacterium]
MNITKASDLDRREFLTGMAQACLGVGLFSSFSAQAADHGGKAKRVIYLYMAGGMSHLDTLDPKQDKEVAGEFAPMRTSITGERISDRLPLLARQLQHAAIIRSMTSKEGSHERGSYFMRTSYPMLGTIQHPGLGAWALKLSGKNSETLPGNINIGARNPIGAGFFEPEFEPLRISRAEAGLSNISPPPHVDEGTFEHRMQLLRTLNTKFDSRFESRQVDGYAQAYEDAVKLMKSSELKAFDIAREPKNLRERYGKNNFGQGCLLARRLVEHGIKFVEVTFGGWDTHTDNFERLEKQLQQLDAGLGTLLDDLHRRRMLEDTLVVLVSEFGRTPEINDGNGRGHHPKAFSCMLAGGGVQGGQVYGATDSRGATVAEKVVSVKDLNATIAHAVGIDPAHELYSKSGRPFTIANGGKPVLALF